MPERPAARGRASLLLAGAVALVVLVGGQLAVGMRASRTATVTGDEPFYLLTARSLVADRDLDLTNQYADPAREMAGFWDGTKPLWRQMEPTADGRLLAPHDPGLAVLIAPAFALGGLEAVRRFLVVLWALALAGAALLARRAGVGRAAAFVAAAVVGLGAPGLVYASQVYPEAPGTLALTVALLVATGRRARPLALAAALVALEWLGVKFLPLALVAAAVWGWRFRHDRRALVTAAAAGGLAGAHFVWWHLHTFGGLTPYSTNVVWAGDATGAILADHLARGGRSYRLYGLFLDARFGLFRWLPFAVLLPWGLTGRLLRRAVGGACLAVLAAAVLLGTFVSITIMGWWFPGRMLVAALPAVAVLLAAAVDRLPRWLTGALAVWSLAIAARLAVAAHTGAVRLAVDPFDLGWPLAPRWLLPDFRSFGLREVALSAAWLGALGGLRLLTSPGDGHAPPARRQLPRLPGLLRPAHRHGDRLGAGDQRGLRLHLDAHQPAEGPPA